jgi:hypothetical protein
MWRWKAWVTIAAASPTTMKWTTGTTDDCGGTDSTTRPDGEDVFLFITDAWLRVSIALATKQRRLAEESDLEMEGEDDTGSESDEMDDGDN